MKTILFDGAGHVQLQPLTFTKPVAELRIGILTLKEKWEHYLSESIGVRTAPYLAAKFDDIPSETECGIAAGLLPTEDLAETIKKLKKNQILMRKGKVLAMKPLPATDSDIEKALKGRDILEYDMDVEIIERPWDIFTYNGSEIKKDFEIITSGKESKDIDNTTTVKGKKVFIAAGAKVSCAILNAENGPIYIGKNAEVMEGAIIRGPFALCHNATVKMSAKIYGDTTVGPHSKVGGEIGNSVIQGYSNKGHDGYLGNSVIGEWCNLGADTNTSNLKNNYSQVAAWSYKEEAFIDTGLQFCGVIMGDHSKCGINTMFNTGTVVGTCANVFDGGFPAKHIPSFAWGGKSGFVPFQLDKALDVAKKVMKRRDIDLTTDEEVILSKIAEDGAKWIED